MVFMILPLFFLQFGCSSVSSEPNKHEQMEAKWQEMRRNSIIFYSDRKLKRQSNKNGINSHFLWLFLLFCLVLCCAVRCGVVLGFFLFDSSLCHSLSLVVLSAQIFSLPAFAMLETLLLVFVFVCCSKVHHSCFSCGMCQSLNGSIISIFSLNYEWNSTCTLKIAHPNEQYTIATKT